MKKRLSRRNFLQMVTISAAGTILAACGQGSKPTSSATQASTQPGAAPVATQAGATPAVTQTQAASVGTTPAPAGQVKLTMWTYPGDEGFLADMFKLYQSSHPNVSMNIVKITMDDMTQKLATVLVAGSGAPDMADIEQGFFRKYCYGTGILDLTPYGINAHKNDLPDWCWNAGLSPDKQKVYFLFYSVGCAVIHYRRSLFKKAGLASDPTSVGDLISKSWDDTLKVGEKFAQPHGPWMFDNATTVFSMYRDQYNPVWYDEATKKFQINTPQMLTGLKLAQQVRKSGEDAKINEFTPEWQNTFNGDTVATYPNGDWMAVFVQQYGGNPTKGDWGMVQVPGNSGASSGGSTFCAFQQSQHKAEAADLITYFTFNPDAQLLLLNYYNFPAYVKTWDSPKMDEPVAFYDNQKIRQVSVAVAHKFSNRVYTPYDNQCTTITLNEVNNVLNQGKDPQKALADAQATAESQIQIIS